VYRYSSGAGGGALYCIVDIAVHYILTIQFGEAIYGFWNWQTPKIARNCNFY